MVREGRIEDADDQRVEQWRARAQYRSPIVLPDLIQVGVIFSNVTRQATNLKG